MRNISEVISQHGRVLGQSKSSPSARALNSQISNQPHQRHPFLHAERNDESPSQLRALFMFSCMFLTASPPNKIISDVHAQWQTSLACAARRLEPGYQHSRSGPGISQQPPTLRIPELHLHVVFAHYVSCFGEIATSSGSLFTIIEQHHACGD